jgi:hypothetical protein
VSVWHFVESDSAEEFRRGHVTKFLGQFIDQDNRFLSVIGGQDVAAITAVLNHGTELQAVLDAALAWETMMQGADPSPFSDRNNPYLDTEATLIEAVRAYRAAKEGT